MKLEDQVCSISLAIKLKELGVQQESTFHWRSVLLGLGEVTFQLHFSTSPANNIINTHSAFTASELLELLPDCIDIASNLYTLTIEKIGDKFYSCYSYEQELWIAEFIEFNLCNSLAKVLIYLIENNLLREI